MLKKKQKGVASNLWNKISLFDARIDRIRSSQELPVMYNNLCLSVSNVVMVHSATLFVLLILMKICFRCKKVSLRDLVFV